MCPPKLSTKGFPHMNQHNWDYQVGSPLARPRKGCPARVSLKAIPKASSLSLPPSGFPKGGYKWRTPSVVPQV
jgi:hypothetical protein